MKNIINTQLWYEVTKGTYENLLVILNPNKIALEVHNIKNQLSN